MSTAAVVRPPSPVATARRSLAIVAPIGHAANTGVSRVAMRNYLAWGIAIVMITAAAVLVIAYQRAQPPAVLVLQHGDMVLSVAFSPDGHRIVTAAGNDAHLWDAET